MLQQAARFPLNACSLRGRHDIGGNGYRFRGRSALSAQTLYANSAHNGAARSSQKWTVLLITNHLGDQQRFEQDCELDERKLHVYVVSRCVRIGTHDMGLVHEVLSRFSSHARQRYLQLDFDAEAIGNDADAYDSVD